MPRIAILGCTGGTGKEVVRQALERNWVVRAICRSPEKLKEFNEHEDFEAVKCDIFNVEELTRHLTDCVAVLSCLGVSGMFWPWSEVTIQQDTIKVITEAMRKAKMEKLRLIVMSAWCTVPKDDNPKMIEWFVKPLFLRGPTKDMVAMESYLEKQNEDMDFTVVKPPQLVNGPETEATVLAVEGEHVPGGSITIRRSDVARFILDTMTTGAWSRKKVSIAVPT